MIARRLIKQIRGKVVYDSGEGEAGGRIKKALSGIGIRLFLIESLNIQQLKDEDIRITEERQVLEASTDNQGEFSFFVSDRDYSVNLDIESLPEGKGVLDARQRIDRGTNRSVEFIVRDIASLEINEKDTSISFGESFKLNPILKDFEGNILTAKVGYSSESTEISMRSGEFRHTPESLMDNKVDIQIDAGSIKKLVTLNIMSPQISMIEKVHLANRAGIIDNHTKIQYLINSLFNKRLLPEEYKSGIPDKSGTRAAEEIRRYMEGEDAYPGISQAALQRLNASVPKLDRVYTSPGGYFNIHYTLTGENAVYSTRYSREVPAYIREVGAAFDQVREITCGIRGFREPILEEGKKAYDVYVYDLKGKYGVTFSSKVYGMKNTSVRVASSYICIDNTYSKEKGFDKSREDCMRVTAAHEFFHAVQYSYNIDSDLWWMEASATWNEDEIYTGVNDYVRYLNSYFSTPSRSLDESSYSGVVFAKFLTENYGGYHIMKKIWEVQAAVKNTSMNAIDLAVRNSYANENIGTLFNRFTAFNFNPAQYYKEGAEWKVTPSISHTYDSYPVSMVADRLNHMASSYQLFKAGSMVEGKALRIAIEGTSDAKWGFKIQRRQRDDGKTHILQIVSSSNFGRTEVILNNIGDKYDEVCFIPANLEKERDGLQYSYSASLK